MSLAEQITVRKPLRDMDRDERIRQRARDYFVSKGISDPLVDAMVYWMPVNDLTVALTQAGQMKSGTGTICTPAEMAKIGMEAMRGKL